MFNLNSIYHMFDYFNNTIELNGQNSNTIEAFRRSVELLVQKGQIDKADWYLVMYVIGIWNTDAVKWDITMTNIKLYRQGSELLRGRNEAEIEKELERMKKSVPSRVYEALSLTFKKDGVKIITKKYRDNAEKKKEKAIKTERKIKEQSRTNSIDTKQYYTYSGCATENYYHYSGC